MKGTFRRRPAHRCAAPGEAKEPARSCAWILLWMVLMPSCPKLLLLRPAAGLPAGCRCVWLGRRRGQLVPVGVHVLLQRPLGLHGDAALVAVRQGLELLPQLLGDAGVQVVASFVLYQGT